MKKSLSLVSAILLVACLEAGAQAVDRIEMSVIPELLIPVGDSSALFRLGGGAALEGRFSLGPLTPFVQARYLNLPTPADKSLVLLSAGGGLGLRTYINSRLGLGLGADGGYYLGTWDELRASNYFLHGSAGLSYRFTPAFSMSLDGSYHHYLGADQPLYQGVGVALSGELRFGGLKGGTRIEAPSIQLDPIFPIFHTFYDDNPVGTMKLVNREDGEIRDVKVSFFLKQYMDQPKVSAAFPGLGRGQQTEVPLFALLNEQVLRLTESTKASAEIIVDYTFLGSPRQARFTETMRLYHRNAMSWDDDRKAAAFVSAKDPAVLRYSKFAAGLIREAGSSEVDQNLRFAMGLFEGLGLYGLNYVVDPTTPYKELSGNKAALDYLQYPYQTLVYKGGDCDDLSILFSAILESVGIRTAFITIPGHIYMAFQLQMDEAAARRTFSNPEELIFSEGRAWLPVEITLVNEGFQKAWLIGAREWQDNFASGSAAFLPLESAWSLYDPVGIPGEDTRIVLPEADQLTRAYTASLGRFIDRELAPRVQQLRDDIRMSASNPRLVNKLGVLYARFGRYDEAQAEFEKAARGGYNPALTNLGNIAYLRKNYPAALDYYQQALSRSADNKVALIGLARAQYELENYPAAGKAYAAVKEMDPNLATEFAYLGSATSGEGRASGAAQGRTGGASWSEE